TSCDLTRRSPRLVAEQHRAEGPEHRPHRRFGARLCGSARGPARASRRCSASISPRGLTRWALCRIAVPMSGAPPATTERTNEPSGTREPSPIKRLLVIAPASLQLLGG